MGDEIAQNLQQESLGHLAGCRQLAAGDRSLFRLTSQFQRGANGVVDSPRKFHCFDSVLVRGVPTCGVQAISMSHESRGVGVMAKGPDWPSPPHGNSDENTPIEASPIEGSSAEAHPFQANPYEASAFGVETAWGAPSVSLPTFVVVMMILAIIFSALRFILEVVGAIGLASGRGEHVTPSMYMEVGVNFIASILGVVASLLILFKKPAGVMFART